MFEILGKCVSWLYWNFGRKYDGNSFWSRVAIYHHNSLDYMDGNLYIAELNRINGNLELKHETFFRTIKNV